jgi:hypothetical protein
MGIKALIENYRIGHIVQRYENGDILIGSPYISDIIRISKEGKILKRYGDGRTNEDLQRYQQEMDDDEATGELKRLIDLPDTFGDLIPIYTYKGANVIKKYCEKPGWPNITTDGQLMYENTFFLTPQQAYNALIINTRISKYELKSLSGDLKEYAAKTRRKLGYIFRCFYRYLKARIWTRVSVKFMR